MSPMDYIEPTEEAISHIRPKDVVYVKGHEDGVWNKGVVLAVKQDAYCFNLRVGTQCDEEPLWYSFIVGDERYIRIPRVE